MILARTLVPSSSEAEGLVDHLFGSQHCVDLDGTIGSELVARVRGVEVGLPYSPTVRRYLQRWE
jgi:hypothetical protein